MTRPVHAQPAARITDEQRALSERSANLCRSNPALWSAMFRYTDGLAAAGVPLDEARRQALELYAPAGDRQGHLLALCSYVTSLPAASAYATSKPVEGPT